MTTTRRPSTPASRTRRVRSSRPGSARRAAPAPTPSRSAPIDPRIRARRVAVTREQGRQRLRVVLAVLGVVIAGLAAWGATRSPLLDVDRVVVRGPSHTTPGEITRAGGIRAGGLMVELDPGASSARIEALPWVQSATVVREWPSTVRISVTERRPVATVAVRGGRWAVVDRTARVLEVGDAPPANLPRVTSEVGAAVPGQLLPSAERAPVTVAAALPADLLVEVPEVSRVGGEVELRYVPLRRGGIPARVRFGAPTQLDDKLLALRTMLDKADLRDMAVLDLRVPDAPVLTRGSP